MITAVTALHLAGVLTLDLAAFAVLACVVHIGAGGTLSERARLAAGALAVVVTGALGPDLALIAMVDLALLGAVCAPSLAAQTRR